VEVVAFTAAELDVSDGVAVSQIIARERPAIIFNTAAYRSTDRAEAEPARAYAVNCHGAGFVATAAQSVGARLVHISTDFVFDGASGRPYRPEDEARPLSVYGASKLAGERAVAASAPRALIVRTAWLYSAVGGNFLTTMLGLMGVGDDVRVVSDQVGTPTSTATLAAALWGLLQADAAGLFHCTDAGCASWYDFAQAIAEEAWACGLLSRQIQVRPILTIERPAPARRPAFSVLDKTRTWSVLEAPAPHWRVALRQVLAGMAPASRR
jgi:dTDP-4-dehydrorhamnose reductase